jgi:hypothetical protein
VIAQFLLLIQICGSSDCHFEPADRKYPSMISCLEAGFTLMEGNPEHMPQWRCEKRMMKPPAR